MGRLGLEGAEGREVDEDGGGRVVLGEEDVGELVVPVVYAVLEELGGEGSESAGEFAAAAAVVDGVVVEQVVVGRTGVGFGDEVGDAAEAEGPRGAGEQGVDAEGWEVG